MENSIHTSARIILNSKLAIALTGAGVSTESGIPDFRSAGGLWTKFDPGEYATIDAFRRNPVKVWKMLRELEGVVIDAIYKKLDIPEPTAEQAALVKEYDDRMLRTEAEALMTRLEDWGSIIKLKVLPVPVKSWTEKHVYTAFLQAYNDAFVDYEADTLEENPLIYLLKLLGFLLFFK